MPDDYGVPKNKARPTNYEGNTMRNFLMGMVIGVVLSGSVVYATDFTMLVCNGVLDNGSISITCLPI